MRSNFIMKGLNNQPAFPKDKLEQDKKIYQNLRQETIDFNKTRTFEFKNSMSQIKSPIKIQSMTRNINNSTGQGLEQTTSIKG